MLYKDYRQNSCYRIMFGVCIADIFQLLANGLFILLGLLNFDLSEDFEKWGGGINAASWNILFFLQLLLALNRCSVVLKNCFLISIKEQELPWERRLFNFLLLLSFVICVGIVYVFVSPYCGIHFTRKFYWSYANQYPWTETVRDIEYKSTGFLPLITFIAYISIVCILKWRRGNQNTGEILSRQERRILLQTSSQFLPLSLLMICGYLLPNNASLDLIAFLNIGSMLICGVNPILYLALNVQFRERFLLMICCRKEKKNKFVMAIPPKTNFAKIIPTGNNLVNTYTNNGPKRVNSMPQISK
nr:unnamed protein product [Meloidogyne enterolobii]